jgi:hypothetical protein
MIRSDRQLVRDLLADVREDLIEARRYVRADHATAESLARDAIDTLVRMSVHDFPSADRVVVNLMFGLRFLLADPQVLESYLYAASFELLCEMEKSRNGY